jgi:hypothetical protein
VTGNVLAQGDQVTRLRHPEYTKLVDDAA